MGVGNVNKKQNLYEIFSIRKIEDKSEVYLTLNSEKEKLLTEFKRFLPINMFFEAKLGKKPKLRINYEKIEVVVEGEDNCEIANSQPLTEGSVLKQMSKVLDTTFRLNSLKCDLDNVFINLSFLNAMRRECIEKLKIAILKNYNNKNIKVEKISSLNSIGEIEVQEKDLTYLLTNNIEQVKNFDLKDKKFIVIYSPLIYSLENIKNFQASLLTLNYSNVLYISLPIVAVKEEVELIDKIFDSLDFNFGVVANNYWGLSHLDKFPVIAGTGLNIYNKNTAKFFIKTWCKRFYIFNRKFTFY